jgi:hypothetical protein
MHDGPVDEFLAELGRHLKRDVATRGRVIAELGDHLRDLVAEGRSRGLDELTAELEAVERFGSPRALARGLRTPRTSTRVALAAALAGAALCGALAFAALRPGTAGPTLPRAGGATALECVVAFTPSTAAGAHQVLVATRIATDPRYGTLRACHSLAAGTFIYDVTGGPPPPAEADLTHDVSMATALHQ